MYTMHLTHCTSPARMLSDSDVVFGAREFSVPAVQYHVLSVVTEIVEVTICKRRADFIGAFRLCAASQHLPPCLLVDLS